VDRTVPNDLPIVSSAALCRSSPKVVQASSTTIALKSRSPNSRVVCATQTSVTNPATTTVSIPSTRKVWSSLVDHKMIPSRSSPHRRRTFSSRTRSVWFRLEGNAGDLSSPHPPLRVCPDCAREESLIHEREGWGQRRSSPSRNCAQNVPAAPKKY